MSLRYPKGSRFRTAAGSPFPISAPRHLDAGGVGPSDEHLAIYPTSPGDCPFWGSSENTTRQLRLKKWMSHENHILMTKFSKFIARRRFFFFFRMTKKKGLAPCRDVAKGTWLGPGAVARLPIQCFDQGRLGVAWWPAVVICAGWSWYRDSL